MFDLKRFLLLGSIGVSLLAGLMFTTHSTVSSTAFAASGCDTVVQGYQISRFGNYWAEWGNTCTVSEGNSSNAVYAIQLDINSLGEFDPQSNKPCNAGTPDGVFGVNTFNAVECYQRAIKASGGNISVDGIVGPQTWYSLGVQLITVTDTLTTGWNYFEDGKNNKDFRMWGSFPNKWYVDAGGCWRQMDENSTACE